MTRLLWLFFWLRDYCHSLFYRICTPSTIVLLLDIRDYLRSCNRMGVFGYWSDDTAMVKWLLSLSGSLKKGDESTITMLHFHLRQNDYMLRLHGIKGPLLRRGRCLFFKVASFRRWSTIPGAMKEVDFRAV